jgi:hypothetical protein
MLYGLDNKNLRSEECLPGLLAPRAKLSAVVFATFVVFGNQNPSSAIATVRYALTS